MQNQIACMWALSNGTILTPQQLLAVYAGKHFRRLAALISTGMACRTLACLVLRITSSTSVCVLVTALLQSVHMLKLAWFGEAADVGCSQSLSVHAADWPTSALVRGGDNMKAVHETVCAVRSRAGHPRPGEQLQHAHPGLHEHLLSWVALCGCAPIQLHADTMLTSC